jgi:hypothetical protein
MATPLWVHARSISSANPSLHPSLSTCASSSLSLDHRQQLSSAQILPPSSSAKDSALHLYCNFMLVATKPVILRSTLLFSMLHVCVERFLVWMC